MLRSKPTETLHVTIERHHKEKENSKVHIGKSESVPNFTTGSKKSGSEGEATSRASFDDQRRERSLSKERNLSFFNFSVFKRTKSDGTELRAKAAKARQGKKVVLPVIGTLPRSFGPRKLPILRKSRSLTEIDG